MLSRTRLQATNRPNEHSTEIKSHYMKLVRFCLLLLSFPFTLSNACLLAILHLSNPNMLRIDSSNNCYYHSSSRNIRHRAENNSSACCIETAIQDKTSCTPFASVSSISNSKGSGNDWNGGTGCASIAPPQPSRDFRRCSSTSVDSFADYDALKTFLLDNDEDDDESDHNSDYSGDHDQNEDAYANNDDDSSISSFQYDTDEEEEDDFEDGYDANFAAAAAAFVTSADNDDSNRESRIIKDVERERCIVDAISDLRFEAGAVVIAFKGSSDFHGCTNRCTEQQQQTQKQQRRRRRVGFAPLVTVREYEVITTTAEASGGGGSSSGQSTSTTSTQLGWRHGGNQYRCIKFGAKPLPRRLVSAPRQRRGGSRSAARTMASSRGTRSSGRRNCRHESGGGKGKDSMVDQHEEVLALDSVLRNIEDMMKTICDKRESLERPSSRAAKTNNETNDQRKTRATVRSNM
jgi:hypothetical protein